MPAPIPDLLDDIKSNTDKTSEAINNLAAALTGTKPLPMGFVGPPPPMTPGQGISGILQLLQQQNRRQRQKDVDEKEIKEKVRISRGFNLAGEAISAAQGFLGGDLRKAALSGSPFQAAGDVVEGLGKIAGKIPVIGKLAESLANVSAAVLRLPESLKRFNQELLNANFRFAQFSGAMALVKAQFDIGQMQLDIQRGNALAPSTQRLARSQLGFQEFLLPMETAFTDFITSLAANVTRLASVVGQVGVEGGKAAISSSKWGAIGAIAAQLGLDIATGKGLEPTPTIEGFQQELQGLAGNWGTIYGLPNRFGTPPPRFIPPNVAGP